MRILHLLSSPVFSGPAENVLQLALAQRALGHEVSVAVDRRRTQVTSEEPAAPRLAAHGLLDSRGLELSVKSTPAGWIRDWRLLRAAPEQVLHVHFTHDHLLARWAVRDRRVVVRSIHAPRSLRRLMPAAAAFTVCTEQERRRLGGARSEILPALLDPAFRPAGSRASVQRSLGVEADPCVGMISAFQPSRRHALGIEAFAALRRSRPKARLVLVGNGILEPALRAQVQAQGLQDAVTFAGYQSKEAFVRWLQALDEVWILGLGNDWSARAALQARACGARVIAVDEGALARWADVVLERPGRDELVKAAQSDTRRDVPLPANAQTAAAVLELYASVGAGA